jgi:predicted dienelactone hydrolase
MNRIFLIVLAAVGTVSLALPICSASASGAIASVRDPKSYPIASTTIVFVDHSRGTPASYGHPALPSRSLSTLVVYPKEPSDQDRQFPLIVYSHGFGATAASAGPTLDSLASHGYVVAAPDFPLSTIGLPGALDLLDYKNQPGDVSFVITRMIKLNGTQGSPVYHRIEVRRVGVVGHSLGAVTTLAVAYNSCCRDTRIGAAIEMDGELNVPIGPTGQFSGTYFKDHNPPLLVINGTKDTIGPYRISQSIYAKAPPPKYFLSLIGAPHEGFAMAPWSSPVNNTIAAFFDRYLGPGQTVAEIQRAGTEPGITTIRSSAR